MGRIPVVLHQFWDATRFDFCRWIPSAKRLKRHCDTLLKQVF